MILFLVESTRHLAKTIRLHQGKVLLDRFSDGELHVKVLSPIQEQSVWVVAGTEAPAENFLQLAFLLETLQRLKAKINLLITYFGYARQDHPEVGEAFAGKVMARCIRQFQPQRVLICHIHSPRLKRFLKYENLIPHELFKSIFRQAEAIAVPDEGALQAGRQLSRLCKLPLVTLTKERPGKETVEIKSLKGQVQRKKIVLFDDMISTGRTLVKAAERLLQEGAADVQAVATHGVFSGDAVSLLEKSPISRIFVTNTLVQKTQSQKIEVIDIAPYLRRTIQAQNGVVS